MLADSSGLVHAPLCNRKYLMLLCGLNDPCAFIICRERC